MHLYRFDAAWRLHHPFADVFAVLTDLERWPLWWPDVRSVDPIDDDNARVVIRAALPYALKLRLTRVEQDETAGRLHADIDGDLRGWITGQVTRSGDETLLTIQQEVVVTKRWMRAVEPLARPVLRANHGVMMWRGRRGAARYLASGDRYQK